MVYQTGPHDCLYIVINNAFQVLKMYQTTQKKLGANLLFYFWEQTWANLLLYFVGHICQDPMCVNRPAPWSMKRVALQMICGSLPFKKSYGLGGVDNSHYICCWTLQFLTSQWKFRYRRWLLVVWQFYSICPVVIRYRSSSLKKPLSATPHPHFTFSSKFWWIREFDR